MPRKGHRSTRGQPDLHNELKKRVNIALTPTGIDGLDTLASEFGVSRSELVEQIGRNLIALHPGALTKEDRQGLLKSTFRSDLGETSSTKLPPQPAQC